MPRHVGVKQSETAPAMPKGRRHYTDFNKQSKIPDANEKPYTVQPTVRANMRVNEESTNHYEPRPMKRVDVPHPVDKGEYQPPKRQPSRTNESVVAAVLEGSSPSPQSRRMSRSVEYTPTPVQQRPVKQVSNHTTTLDRDIQ
eukprot:CAMPEP_0174856690 /NCGR_PEP_ID=MMETSP1114-20130205/36169_1 /TAXON_ID=312471 /ORGANISM="Neobodo designis, Strain CCAP 1951/1" /LENGTH=141 /DNA_ID=CAMNT_0016091495 /DNA_START=35 /DNA_END=460 /DNA_ORIENTATION=+